jgi:hypothetical protein
LEQRLESLQGAFSTGVGFFAAPWNAFALLGNNSGFPAPRPKCPSVEKAGGLMAIQGGTPLLLHINGLAETEVPVLALQLRLPQAFWALKVEFVDRSIDRSIFDRDASFGQGISRTALPLQSRLRTRESQLE